MEEHRKLCAISDLASKMLSPFFLVLVSAHIPLTYFCFYVSLHPPRTLLGDVREINLVTFSAGAIYWLFLTVVTIAVILMFASRVNAKVSDRILCSDTILHQKNVAIRLEQRSRVFLWLMT